MRVIIFLILMLTALSSTHAQGLMADMKFHEGSNFFINGKTDQALKSVNDGLRQDPGHSKLQELKKLLEQQKKEDQKKEQEKKEQEKKEQEQQKKDQQKKDQEKKDQEKKDQEKKDQQQKDQEKKDQEQKDQKDQQKKDDKEKSKEEQQKEQQEKDKKEKDDLPPEVKKRLEEMNMSEEKSKMILEALKNREVQYLQENKRKSKQRPESDKPDW